MFCHHSNLIFRLSISFIALSLSYQILANHIDDCQGNVQYKKQLSMYWPKNQFKESADNEYWLTIKQAQRLPNDVMWVDVRSKLAQTNNPLNVLTIPLNQLGNKDFLFDKTVVLIGTGFDQIVINKAINILKAKGFKHLFALSGGIRTWNELKQPKAMIPDEISPEEFLLGGESITWQVITVGLTTEEDSMLSEKAIRRFDLSKESTLALNYFLGNEPTKHDMAIRYVLITPNQQITLHLKRQLNLSKSNNIVWLKGGFSNYQHYIQQQNNLINNTGQSLSQPCRLTL